MKKTLVCVLTAFAMLLIANGAACKPANPNLKHKVHKKYVGELCLCYPPMHQQKESRCECYPYYEYSR